MVMGNSVVGPLACHGRVTHMGNPSGVHQLGLLRGGCKVRLHWSGHILWQAAGFISGCLPVVLT